MTQPLFNPDWLPKKRWPRSIEDRFGAGIEIDCPVHVGCRIQLWFTNPVDGFGPMGSDDDRLYWREGECLGTLTLWPPVNAGEHGMFEIVEGNVIFRLQ